MYGYSCEYCEGTVKERMVAQEVFKHKNGFVMLENVPIGICDQCGYRYYNSKVLKRVEEIADGKQVPMRTESIPVAQYKSKRGLILQCNICGFPHPDTKFPGIQF